MCLEASFFLSVLLSLAFMAFWGMVDTHSWNTPIWRIFAFRLFYIMAVALRLFGYLRITTLVAFIAFAHSVFMIGIITIMII